MLIYAFALSIIIALISTSFLIERKLLHSQKKFASIINISGKQRMLSLRLTVLAQQLKLVNDVNNLKSLQQEIKKNLTELKRYYFLLSEEGMTELNSAKTRTISTSNREIVNQFFNYANQLTTDAVFHSTRKNQVVKNIQLLAGGSILKLFDELTLEREVQANRILQDYIEFKYFLYLCTVILVLLEGVLLFYPLARKNLKNSIEIIHLHREEEKLKKFSELGEVFSTTIHEISNPLSVALYKVSSLIKRSDSQQAVNESLSQVEKNLLRIAKIIKSAKSIYRQGDNDLVMPVLLSRVTHEAIEAASILRSIKEIDINVIVHKEIVVEAREHQVFQVFLNLIINAIDALSNLEQKNKTISIEINQESDFAVFRIKDTGHGISETDEEKIFKSLYTTKVHGTGMGLTECKRIMESYGGTIRLNRCLGPSCFEVLFPC